MKAVRSIPTAVCLRCWGESPLPEGLCARCVAKVERENGCDFCGHRHCRGCCWKCKNPECMWNVAGECPDCPKAEPRQRKPAA